MERRYLYEEIWQEFSTRKSMLFLAGPRQVGKTTFAQMAAESSKSSLYTNWDITKDRERILTDPTFFVHADRDTTTIPLIIFDEIHKYRHWKNYLKGIYDQFNREFQFLILGSGRLNVYKKGGDSLAGRYLLLSLFPFTIAELATRQHIPFEEWAKNPLRSTITNDTTTQNIWEHLEELSGFPEPYLSGTKRHYRTWAKNYREQLIREDVRSLTEVRDLDALDLLFALLPTKVGSPLSYASLARDLQVSPPTIPRWITLFDHFFLTFCIRPWKRKIARSIQKEQKLYLYDYARINDPSIRYENMIALELLRAVTHWNEMGYGDFGLFYLRNKDGQEVDFLLTQDLEPWLLVEAKYADVQPTKPLKKFQKYLGIPALQLVRTPGICRRIPVESGQDILVTSATQWLSSLP